MVQGIRAAGGQPDNPPNGWVDDAPSMAHSGTPKCGKCAVHDLLGCAHPAAEFHWIIYFIPS